MDIAGEAVGAAAVVGEAGDGVGFALALRQAAIRFGRYRAVVVREAFGVGVSEGAALGALHLEGPLTPTVLAARLNVGTPAMTEVLDRLERAGHVRRGPHPSDRRKVMVTITEHATTLIDRELPAFAALLAPALAGIDAATVEVIMRVLDTASSALDHAARHRAAAQASTGPTPEPAAPDAACTSARTVGTEGS